MRNEAGRRSQRFFVAFSTWRRRFAFAPLRRRRHQHLTTTGQGARLLRRQGRLQPLPGLRGRGRRRHLAVGVSPSRPRRRVDASAALARCWLAGGLLVGPDSKGDVGGPAFAARPAAVSSRCTSRPVASSAPEAEQRPGSSPSARAGVARRRRRRLDDDLHLAGRGGAAAGAGVAASAEVEDDGPVSAA